MSSTPTEQPNSAEQQEYTRYVPLKYMLMGAFLLLIIPILVSMSVFDYLNAKRDLESAYKLLQQQTENNILNAIRLVDAGHKVLENFLGKEMRNAFKVFVAEYEAAGRDPAKMDLDALKEKLGGKMDLYIINAAGVVEYTTYRKDLGLDFKQWTDFYENFTKMRLQTGFINGRLATEARTGILRKFSYMPTPDNKYLLELGLVSDEFKDLMGELDLVKIANRLKALNPSLNKVQIFSRHGHLLGDPDYKVTPDIAKVIADVYDTKIPQELYDGNKRLFTLYTFVNLRDGEELFGTDPSKVIALTYNSKLIDDSLERIATFHIVLGIIVIVLSIFFTFIIAAWITRPIQHLVESVNIIARFNLEHPIKVKTNTELKLLKQSIAMMVESMLKYINQIKRQNNELKELNRLKDDFLSNTSHELRTPLNGIIGIADSMIDGAAGKLPRQAIENLSMIVLSGRRLSNLVNDILDFSKLKHKSIELQRKPIDIKIVTDVVVTLSQPLIGRKPVKLLNEIQDVPPVEADENRIQQVLHNLIGNAIKFTEAGTVIIRAKVLENQLQMTISDTGIGISADKLQRVFNPFEQGDGSISREYGGTGLGLSITKQLIELHGGTIWIDSVVDEGSHVHFILPLAQGVSVAKSENAVTLLNQVRDSQAIEVSMEIEEDEAIEGEIVDKTDINNVNTGKTIVLPVLIVDDDPINLQVLENMLRVENYAVTRCSHGHEALEAVQSGKVFAIVLLDIMMPKMSGFEVCRILRQTYPATQLPIIMLTAKNQVSDLVEGLQSGANDYLTKPLSKGELLTRMKTHIQLARINIAYSTFVPVEFLKLLQKESIIDVRLGDHVQKYMAVLFADIRSFTTLSETMTPKENFDFINEYLGRVGPVVRRHNGFIDKYIGDAIMALFPDNADDAIAAAMAIHRQLSLFNQERQLKGLLPISVGIGVHIGTLMLGTIGEEKRMEGTVISDAVNLASRLEGLTKMYGVATVVSEAILRELKTLDNYAYRFIGKVRVKGKQEPVQIFEMIDVENQDMQHRLNLQADFNQAINAYYDKQFKYALPQFERLYEADREDKVIGFYLERCRYYAEQGAPDGWEGIEALSEK